MSSNSGCDGRPCAVTLPTSRLSCWPACIHSPLAGNFHVVQYLPRSLDCLSLGSYLRGLLPIFSFDT